MSVLALPSPLLDSLHGLPGFDAAAFSAVHESGVQVSSVRFNPAKWKKAGVDLPMDDAGALAEVTGLPVADGIPWSSYGCYLRDRPVYTTDPLLHGGAYYVQEASSMFLEQAIRQCCGDGPLRALDLCAAPGGKSTLIQSVLGEGSLLVSNEVIKARVNILAENMVKWGAVNTVVTNNDPRHFQKLGAFFDLIVVDAPCSGSGLFRRDPGAIAEWSEDAVLLCCQRQQRILADILPALNKGGVLIYATCSYSPEEDEVIADWLVDEQGLENIRLQLPVGTGIVESAGRNSYGYRFFPDRLKGEGLFIACFRKGTDGYAGSVVERPKRALPFTPGELQVLQLHLEEPGDFSFIRQREEVLALPPALHAVLPVLQDALYLRRAGIKMGKLIGGTLVPDHELALSTAVSRSLPRIVLDKPAALQYLRRQDFTLPPAEKGWNIISYNGFDLGWVKAMPNRFNNYYPTEWRILMKD